MPVFYFLERGGGREKKKERKGEHWRCCQAGERKHSFVFGTGEEAGWASGKPAVRERAPVFKTRAGNPFSPSPPPPLPLPTTTFAQQKGVTPFLLMCPSSCSRCQPLQEHGDVQMCGIRRRPGYHECVCVGGGGRPQDPPGTAWRRSHMPFRATPAPLGRCAAFLPR